MERTANNTSSGAVPPVTTIRPQTKWLSFDFHELWAYRELLYFLTWRDIKVRYKQTVIGFLWAILQPLLMTLVFNIFFGLLLKVQTEGYPYVLYLFAALLPWNLFASGVTRAAGSLIYDAALIQKVYFPRIISPLAGIFSPLLDFVFSFLVLIAFMVWYHHMPGLAVFTLIPFLLLLLMFTFGVGLWFAALNVEFRDVNYILPFLVQLLFFASPVIYPASIVPGRYQVAYGILNPMSGIIGGFRWALLGAPPPGPLTFASVGIVVVVLVSGILYFRFREKVFADVV